MRTHDGALFHGHARHVNMSVCMCASTSTLACNMAAHVILHGCSMLVPSMSARVYDCVCRCSLNTCANPRVCVCVYASTLARTATRKCGVLCCCSAGMKPAKVHDLANPNVQVMGTRATSNGRLLLQACARSRPTCMMFGRMGWMSLLKSRPTCRAGAEQQQRNATAISGRCSVRSVRFFAPSVSSVDSVRSIC